ncbi:hypothetical protein DPMN_041608 [Dreissena polymorpha]|uniref:Uncharacterized protein n=1 Tax=Dreissena polymorpha TaxID=45954 RepID=A0A9D4CZ42_DREPO|nr:hypothetical protein DPMN_041608 [Dreissena polymorpha]
MTVHVAHPADAVVLQRTVDAEMRRYFALVFQEFLLCNLILLVDCGNSFLFIHPIVFCDDNKNINID